MTRGGDADVGPRPRDVVLPGLAVAGLMLRRVTDRPLTAAPAGPAVLAVSASDAHDVRKANRPSIRLVAGLGVEGDAHAGATVQHLSRVRRDPSLPNLRQVHLISVELRDELRDHGYDLAPGEMGENVTTAGLDLLRLARGTLLRLGHEAVIEVTGLRNPCRRLDELATGSWRRPSHGPRTGA